MSFELSVANLKCAIIELMVQERKHKRAPLTAHVMLLIGESKPQVVMRGMVAEISFGGAGLYLVKPINVGVKVKLEIRFMLAGGGIKTTTLEGMTLYSNLVGDTHFVGIKFDQELNPKNQPDLYNRIEDILESY